MMKQAYALILAGGRGERFWPLSTARRPKQLLALTGKRPMLAAAAAHLGGIIPPGRILVITSAELAAAARRMLPSLPRRNIIGEPMGRDTAAAIALGAAHIKERDPGAVFCVLTADHVIRNPPLFQRALKKAFALAGAARSLLTIGIRPTFPSTAFGYIEAGPRLSRTGAEAFMVKRFVEKPDQATAARYLKTGRFFWNSGMFVWSLTSFEEALARYRPPLHRMLERLAPYIGSARLPRLLETEYRKLEKISVDYAVMEKADNIVMIRGDFGWDDVGSWSALENHYKKDADGNVVIGRAEHIDARGNIIVAERGPAALIGVSGLVVVQAGNAVLVCQKNRAQDVKIMVELLRRKRHHDAL